MKQCHLHLGVNVTNNIPGFYVESKKTAEKKLNISINKCNAHGLADST